MIAISSPMIPSTRPQAMPMSMLMPMLMPLLHLTQGKYLMRRIGRGELSAIFVVCYTFLLVLVRFRTNITPYRFDWNSIS